jgi:hypothetical protein
MLLSSMRKIYTSLFTTRYRKKTPVLLLESLEDRLTPAGNGTILTVTSALDPTTLTPGTLRYAVAQANSDGSAGLSDTIDFNLAQMGTSTITLLQGNLELTAGSGTVTINGAGTTISGNNASRVFTIDNGAYVDLTELAIRDANSATGALVNSGTLALSDVTL